MKRDTVEKSLIDISSAFEVSKTSFLFWYVHSSVEKQQHNKSRHRTMRYQTWTSQMAIKISLYPERSCRCCCCITNVFIKKFYLWFPLVTIIPASLTKKASNGDTSKMILGDDNKNDETQIKGSHSNSLKTHFSTTAELSMRIRQP